MSARAVTIAAVVAAALTGAAVRPDLALAFAVVIMAATLAACITFLILYRPWLPTRHNRAGRHLLYVNYCLTALYGVSLVNHAAPIPHRAMAVLTVAILGAICVVMWQRVALLRSEQRHHRRRRTSPPREEP